MGAARKREVVEFAPAALLAVADSVLEQPPRGVLPRVPCRGALVGRFVFPLHLCSPENRHSHGRNWAHAARKDELWEVMRQQYPVTRSSPLAGRPLIRQIRFSNREPDLPGEGFKTAIDFLCVPRVPKKIGGRFKRGLGFLVDDAPKYVERAAWWEYVPKGQGFALLEVWADVSPIVGARV